MLEGYAAESTLDARVTAQIPLFARKRLLFSYLVFAEAWGFAGLSREQERYFEERRRWFTSEPVWPPR